MLKGKATLTLLIGPGIPIPAPRVVMDSLTSIEVNSGSGENSGFQLTFTFSGKSPLNTLMLLMPQIGPVIRVIIVVTLNGMQNVLIDGTIVQHQLSPNISTGESTLTLNGKDLTSVMSLIDFTGTPYPGMPAEARVLAIIAKYSMFGLIPKIIPSVFFDVPLPIDRIPVHNGKDLEYITKLATDVGYVFYLEPGLVPGTSFAYWGPEIKVGVPQKPLNVNMDIHSNVESLSATYNGASRTMPVVYIQNSQSREDIPIPIPDITPLNPPLGLIPPIPSRFNRMTETSKLSPVQAIAKGIAVAASSADVVTLRGTLDVVRYGNILKSRALVSVRGAGDAFNGLYYVKSVKHKIKKGEYKQDFVLTRNGLVSTIPKIPV